MSYLFDIFPTIRCFYSDWFWFYFIYDCQVHLGFGKVSNVNPKCFCKDTWETLLLLKRKEGWQTFLSYLENIAPWPHLLRSGLKLIYHWKVHCFILSRSVLSSGFAITESWITRKKTGISKKLSSWELNCYIKNNNGPRMKPSETPALILFHEEDCPFSATLCFLFIKNRSKTFNKLSNIPFSCNLNTRPST